MFLSYDSEGDILEVIFNEELHHAEQTAYRLRQGIILYVTLDRLQPVQLTLGNYRALMHNPHIKFEGWKKIPLPERKLLQPILASSLITPFLRIDLKTGYGHIPFPSMPAILAHAA